MSRCEEAEGFFLTYLERDIAAHERGDFDSIGEKLDFCWSLVEGCNEENEEEGHRLSIAITFWDYWTDARNHNWGYYPGVECHDWPVIARQICRGIRESWDTDKMRDNFALTPPPKPVRVSWWKSFFPDKLPVF